MEWTVHHGSYPDGLSRCRRCWHRVEPKLRGQQAALGGPANLQAATRVNPEQASKVKSRMSTRLNYGEDRRVPEKQPSLASGAIRRGNGSGMQRRKRRQRGRPERVGDRCPQRFLGERSARDSEGLIVLVKPGNSGGGKEPYFKDAFGDGPQGGLA